MDYEFKFRTNEESNKIVKDFDDKTWRKIELRRLAFDIVDRSEEYEKSWDKDEKLEYLEEFAGEIVERVTASL